MECIAPEEFRKSEARQKRTLIKRQSCFRFRQADTNGAEGIEYIQVSSKNRKSEAVEEPESNSDAQNKANVATVFEQLPLELTAIIAPFTWATAAWRIDNPKFSRMRRRVV